MQTYKHSGVAPVGSLIKCLLAGLAAAAIGAFVYAWATQWIPIIYLNLLGTLAFGWLVGWIVGVLANLGRVRNSLVVGAIAAFCMTVGLWAYWGASIWAMGGTELGVSAWSPLVLLAFAQHLYENGSWGFKNGAPVTGPFLAGIWLLEAGTLYYMSVKQALGQVRIPYCEQCGEWTEVELAVAAFDATGQEPVWQRVITDDLPALGEVPLLVEDKSNYVRLDFAKCPKCEHSNFMTLQAVSITVNNKGETKTKEKTLISHGVLTAEQSEIIRHLAAMAVEETTTLEPETPDEAAVAEEDENGSATA